MFKEYLHIDVKIDDLKQGPSSTIQLLAKESDIADLLNTSALKHIAKQAFEDNKSSIALALDEVPHFYVALPDKSLESLRLAGASTYDSLKQHKVKQTYLSGLDGLDTHEAYAFLEGLLLNSYDFNKYKAKKTSNQISLSIAPGSFDSGLLESLKVVVQANTLAKTLVNEPVNYLNALTFSERIVEAGKTFGFETEVLHKKEIEELNMGGLLGVNLGSSTPPTFNILHYKPDNATNEKPLVLVGKGVTFDTGGYSLKISGYMLNMKSDMGGGAGVLGALSAIAGNKLPYHVIGIIPATDNMISSDALVVDDVITISDGTTVEVQNTDAEGRLILSDALVYAKQFNPELVIDLATLTGASAAITGPFGSSVLGNAQQEIEQLKEAGETVYERLVQLPLWQEYRDLLDSDIADIRNIGGPTGGVSTAAKFLEHFTDYPWIHIDIAGAAFIKDSKGYKQKGGTGVCVRMIYEFVKNKANK